jgi:type II secretory pathway component PulK
MGFFLSGRSQDDRGFILIFAIAACVLLATIGVIVSRSVQSALRATHTAIAVAQARALADGGVALAVARAQTGGTAEPFVCRLAGAGDIAVSIEDEAGKVPLNSDNAALLTAFFEGLGASRDEARQYVARIADYRDADDVARSGGAESEAYAAAGLLAGPKNADFETVAELDRVLALPSDLRAAAKPHLTAAIAANGVDAAAASDALLELLAGDAAAAFGGRPVLAAEFAVRSSRAYYRIRSVGAVAGARYLREMIVARPQRPGERWRQLSWMQGEINPKDEALLQSGGEAPPC